MRIALSPAADERLNERRLRRLLALELRGVAEVLPESTGPLSEDAVRVWLHVPNPRRAVIEVRRTDRSLARRSLRIEDHPADLAARLVAIATSEMVQVQARPLKPKPPPAQPKPPPNHESAFRVDAGGALLVLPTSAPLLLGGPELALEYRRAFTGQILYARWLIGEGDEQRARWLEIGASFDLRFELSEMWHLRLAAKAGGVALALPEAVLVDNNESRGGKEWMIRAGGLVGIEASLTDDVAFALTAEPGACLRKLHVLDGAGNETEVGGFAMGIGLTFIGSPP